MFYHHRDFLKKTLFEKITGTQCTWSYEHGIIIIIISKILILIHTNNNNNNNTFES